MTGWNKTIKLVDTTHSTRSRWERLRNASENLLISFYQYGKIRLKRCYSLLWSPRCPFRCKTTWPGVPKLEWDWNPPRIQSHRLYAALKNSTRSRTASSAMAACKTDLNRKTVDRPFLQSPSVACSLQSLKLFSSAWEACHAGIVE